MTRMISILAAVLLCNVSIAQVSTTVKEGAKATGEKAAQYGDEAKAAVSSQPGKATNKAKAHVHKAKAHEDANASKDAARQIGH